MLYAADSAWWKFRQDAALKFQGLKVTIDDSVPFADVLVLKNSGREGIDDDPSCLRSGNNSGYQALQIAVHAGATEVHLFGFDMKLGHWHPEHAKPLSTTSEETYRRWIEKFERLAPLISYRGVRVINCTANSALKCFEMGSIDG